MKITNSPPYMFVQVEGATSRYVTLLCAGIDILTWCEGVIDSGMYFCIALINFAGYYTSNIRVNYIFESIRIDLNLPRQLLSIDFF